MSEVYEPDRWMVIKIDRPDGQTVHRVLGGWYGDFLQGNIWRMNSGIVRVEEDGDNYIFHGHTGSRYVCHKECEGYTSTTLDIFETLKAEATEQNIKVEVVLGNSCYERLGN